MKKKLVPIGLMAFFFATGVAVLFPAIVLIMESINTFTKERALHDSNYASGTIAGLALFVISVLLFLQVFAVMDTKFKKEMANIRNL